MMRNREMEHLRLLSDFTFFRAVNTMSIVVLWVVTILCLFPQTVFAVQPDSALLKLSSIAQSELKLKAVIQYFDSEKTPKNIHALNLLNEALEIARSSNNKEAEAKCCLLLGRWWQDMDGHDKSSDYYFKSLKIYRALNDRKNEILLLRRIGDNLRATVNYNVSVYYLQEAIVKAEELQDTIELAKSYNRLAATYFEIYTSYAWSSPDLRENKIDLTLDKRSNLLISRHYFDTTLAAVRKALFFSERKQLTIARISTLNILSALYNSVEAHSDSSKILFEYAINLAKKENARDELFLLYRNYSGYYEYNKDYPNQYKYALFSFQIAKDLGNNMLLHMAAVVMAKACENLKLYKDQVYYLKIVNELNNTIYITDSKSRILLQKAEFEEERNEQRLKAEKKLNNIIIISFASIVLLLIIFTGILTRRNKQIRAVNAELNEKNALIQKQHSDLQKVNHSKDRFFSIVSHDLKSPFTGLLGYSKVLIEDFDNFSREELRDGLAALQKTVESLYDLTVNLLHWAELQLNSTRHEPTVLDVPSLLHKLQGNLSINAKSKDLTIYTNIIENDLVFADKDAVYCVLHNLLSNAIKFSPRGSSIELTVNKSNEYLEVAVKDQGVGLSMEKISELFQLEKSNSSRGTEGEKGTGLGLLICKEMIELNKGTLKISSEINKGSVFSFTLPLYFDTAQ